MIWGAAALVMMLASPAAAQNPVPQFRTRTELVQVDVVVLDSEGRPVRGLTPADFQLLDDGRPRAIETFAEVAHDSGAASVLPAPEPGVADNTAARMQRLVVLLIHDLGLWQERLEKNKEMARRIVRDLGPRVSMAVVFSSGRGGIEFTTNPEDAIAAIDAMRGQLWHNRSGREYLIRTIEDVARTLRTEQAHRKAIIAITEGIPFDVLGLFERMEPRPGAERTDIPLLAMMAALHESNVMLYAVDPRGRLQTTEERSRESRGTNPILRMRDPQFHSQESMWLTTEASGGFAIVDTNEIEADLDRIVADLDSYYLLGFRPDSDDDDWRKLEVRVDRPGLTVRHRKQYKPGAKPPPPRNSDPLEAAIEGIIPETALPLRISTRVGPQGEDRTEVVVKLQIRSATASTPKPDTLEALVVAVDLDEQEVVEEWTRRVDAATEIEVPIELPRGRYQLRAAVRSERRDSIGSVYLTLEIK